MYTNCDLWFLDPKAGSRKVTSEEMEAAREAAYQEQQRKLQEAQCFMG